MPTGLEILAKGLTAFMQGRRLGEAQVREQEVAAQKAAIEQQRWQAEMAAEETAATALNTWRNAQLKQTKAQFDAEEADRKAKAVLAQQKLDRELAQPDLDRADMGRIAGTLGIQSSMQGPPGPPVATSLPVMPPQGIPEQLFGRGVPAPPAMGVPGLPQPTMPNALSIPTPGIMRPRSGMDMAVEADRMGKAEMKNVGGRWFLEPISDADQAQKAAALNQTIASTRATETGIERTLVGTELDKVKLNVAERDWRILSAVPDEEEIAGKRAAINLLFAQLDKAETDAERQRLLLGFEETNGPIGAWTAVLGVIATANNQERAREQSLMLKRMEIEAAEARQSRSLSAASERQDKAIAARATSGGAKPMAPSTENAFIAEAGRLNTEMQRDPQTALQTLEARVATYGGWGALSASTRHAIGTSMQNFLGKTTVRNRVSTAPGTYGRWEALAKDLRSGGGPPQVAPQGATAKSAGEQPSSGGRAAGLDVRGGLGVDFRPTSKSTKDYYAVGVAAAKRAMAEIPKLIAQMPTMAELTAATSSGSSGGPGPPMSAKGLVTSPWSAAMLKKGYGQAGWCNRATRECTGYGDDTAAHMMISLPERGFREIKASEAIPGENVIIVDPTMAKGVGHSGVGAWRDGKLVWVSVMSGPGVKKGSRQAVSVRSLSPNAHVFVRR